MVMSVLSFAKTNLDQFFASIEPYGSAYANPEFAFLIHFEDDGPKLVASRLTLQPLTAEQRDVDVEVGAFYGCRMSLNSLGLDPKGLIESLLHGKIPSPSRSIVIAQNDPHQPFLLIPNPSDERFLNQKISRLHGVNFGLPARLGMDHDWDLRASATPYSNVVDLKVSLGLADDSAGQFEVVAFPPILIDATTGVSGEVAQLAIRCIKTLSKEQVRLGYIVRDPTGGIMRGTFSGPDLHWVSSPDLSEVIVGTVQMPVPKASVVHCFAVYGSRCLHHHIVGDPSAYQNPLRTILEAYDPNLDLIRDRLQSIDKGQQLSQESAVAALLWALGFAPIQFGRSDAPDIIAVSHDGHIIVVECTLGDLKTKRSNKLQKLLDRTRDVRSALDRSNAAHRNCIPVLVTARKRSEIEDDVAECERRGVIVYTHEDIEPLIGQSLWLPASDIRYQELKERHTALLEAGKDPQK